ncbi:unnamed protein product [Urochloa humidicola]
MRQNVVPPESPPAPATSRAEEPQREQNEAGDAMSRAVKRKAVEEAGSGDGGHTLVRELQMRVKTLEAEIERIKRYPPLQPANDDGPAAATRGQTRDVVSPMDPAAAAGRHISSLGDDLLLEIFLRLPSLATLVRAACTCPAWRRLVASSPDFRRRFLAHHPSPLLGFFFQAYDPEPTPDIPAFPAFVPYRTRDRDLAAAIRGGDFFLTSLQGRPDEPPCWEIMDGSRGYLLLVNSDAKLIAVFNPVTRHTERIFDIISLDSYGMYPGFAGALLWEEDDSMSFSVVLITSQEEKRVQLIVFTSDTGSWSVTPWVDFPARPDGNGVHNSLPIETSMQANGFLYWVYEDHRYMVSLGIATMEFSVTELPQCLSHTSFDVCHTKDGKTYIVYADRFSIGVCLMHTGDDNGVDRCVLDRVVPMDNELQRVLPAVQFGDNRELIVLEVRNGYVYLATSDMHHDPQTPCWFMTLCLETMKLEVLFRRTFDNFVHPYIMAWPPSLLGNDHH